MIDKKSLLSSFSWVAFSNLVTKPLWMLLFVYAARVLGTSQYGVYTLAISIVSISAIFIDFGFDYLAINRISQDNSKLSEYFSDIFISRSSIMAILIVIVLAYGKLAQGVDDVVFASVILLLLFQTSTLLLQFLKSVTSAYQEFNKFAIMMIIEKLAITVAGFVSLFLSSSLVSFLFAITLANMITLTAFTIYVYKTYDVKFGIASRASYWNFIQETLPILVINIFILAYFRVDVIIMEFILKDKNIMGIYGSIHRIVEMYMLIPTVLMSTSYPIVSKYYLENRDLAIKLVDKVLQVLIIVTLPLALIFSFNSYEVNLLFFGSQYKEGFRGLEVLIWTTLPLGFNFVLGHLLISINKQKLCAMSVGIASFLNIILNLFLTSYYSFVGTSIALLITETFIFVFYGYFTLKHFGPIMLKVYLQKIVQIILINMGAFYLYSKLYPYNFIVCVSYLVVLNLICLYIYGFLRINSIKNLVSLKSTV